MLFPSAMIDELAIPGVTSWTSFPWRSMHTVFGNNSIKIRNWPEGVSLPPINVEDLEKEILGKPKDVPKDGVANVKSIRSLPRTELYLLALALRNKKYPFHFEIHTDGHPTGELIAADTPYIAGTC